MSKRRGTIRFSTSCCSVSTTRHTTGDDPPTEVKHMFPALQHSIHVESPQLPFFILTDASLHDHCKPICTMTPQNAIATPEKCRPRTQSVPRCFLLLLHDNAIAPRFDSRMCRKACVAQKMRNPYAMLAIIQRPLPGEKVCTYTVDGNSSEDGCGDCCSVLWIFRRSHHRVVVGL